MKFLRRVMVVAALVACLVWLSAAPAAAHTGFESSDPADGTTIDEPLEQIVLRFSGPAQPSGEGFVILDPAGVVRPPDAVTSDAEEKVWTLGFEQPLTGGAVGFRWTVQAPDAHPINGAFSFTVSAPATQTADTDTDTDPDPAAANEPATSTVPERPVVSEAQSAQNLEAFVAQSEVTVPNAKGVGAFGRLLGFVGTMLGIGGLAFGAVVIRDHRRDLRSVLKAVRYAAVVVVVGTAIDLAAHLAVANDGWSDALAAEGVKSAAVSAYGLAVTLRVVAGLFLFAAARITHSRVSGDAVATVERELVFAGTGAPTGSSPGSKLEDSGFGAAADLEDPAMAQEPDESRTFPVSPTAIASVLVLLASFTFDGHTVTEGNRWITGTVDMIHVVAASIWAGGVVAFVVVLWRRHRRGERLNGLEMALRFSVIAGAALATAGVAGTILAAIILDTVSELWTTPWGRLLIAKAIAVGAAASLGTYNHFVVIPWMEAHPDDDQRSVRLRNTATGEALLLAAVVILTAFLVGASSQP